MVMSYSMHRLHEIRGWHAQKRAAGLDVEVKRREYEAALKGYNRAQALLPTLSDEMKQSQADAERLKLQVQEKVRLAILQGSGRPGFAWRRAYALQPFRLTFSRTCPTTS